MYREAVNLSIKKKGCPLVLVADDDEDNRIYLCNTLDICWNIKSIAAKNGKEAINLAVSKQPDLILMDVVMPEMCGLEATQFLKSNSETNEIPVIATTGLCYEKEIEQIQNAGCDDYICKPFSIEDLEKKIFCLIKKKSI